MRFACGLILVGMMALGFMVACSDATEAPDARTPNMFDSGGSAPADAAPDAS